MDEQIEMPLSSATSASPREKGTLTGATKSKKIKRRQIIQTVCLYVGFFSLGLSSSIVGPTLLDLQRITGSSTKEISFIFMARSIVGLCGAILAGFLVDILNHWMLLTVVMIICGVVNIIIPYMRLLSLLCIVMGIAGATGAFYDAGGNMTLLKVWGAENGPWMQALHCIFGAGALIGPLLAIPFLGSQAGVESPSLPLYPTSSPENASLIYQEASGLLSVLSNVTFEAIKVNYSHAGNNHTETIKTKYESKVYWAYLVLGLMLWISAILFFIVMVFCSDIKLQCRNRQRKSPDSEDKKDAPEEKDERVFRLKLTAIVFFFYLFYCILEINYGNYLTTYVVKDLGWTEQEGARLTSGYWTTFTLGRALGIVLVKVMAPWALLTVDLCISAVSLAVILFFSHHHYAVLWVCTLTLGLGISTVFATGITWTEQYIKVTGITGSVFMVACAGGEMVGPVIIGVLFDKLGPKSFLYIMCLANVILVALFITMQCFAGKHGKRHEKPPKVEETCLHENGTADKLVMQEPEN